MGLLDSITGMFGSKKVAAPSADPNSLIQQAQQFATDNKDQVANAIDKVTEVVPGTVDNQIGDAAKSALGVETPTGGSTPPVDGSSETKSDAPKPQ